MKCPNAQKKVKWKDNFSIPFFANLSPESESFILNLISFQEKLKNIIAWNNKRKMKAPFIKELKNDYDTNLFDTFQEQEPFYPSTSSS